MSIDALFQLGIVSAALNTSQTEECFSRSERRTTLRATAATARRPAGLRAASFTAPLRRCIVSHSIQTQVYSGRMPI